MKTAPGATRSPTAASSWWRNLFRSHALTTIKLVLVRHGESTWNRENRFTGWTDVDLSEKGRQEATQGGKVLKAEGYTFDVAYTSVLKRAIRTLWTVLDEMDQIGRASCRERE